MASGRSLLEVRLHIGQVFRPTVHQANAILLTDRPKQELATYLHAALGSPAPSTLLRAIRRGHLIMIPGLTTNLISKHLPKSIATTLGHQDQEAKHLRSTKVLPLSTPNAPPPIPIPCLLDNDIALLLAPASHELCAMLMAKTDISKSYSDQTGKFPIPSSHGNHYIFILYH
jgi:hypothetical protein